MQVGEHNQCEFNDAGKEFLEASVVTEHPDFKIDAPDVNNDIAVLKVFNLAWRLIHTTSPPKMAADLPFSDKVAPACLPTE